VFEAKHPAGRDRGSARYPRRRADGVQCCRDVGFVAKVDLDRQIAQIDTAIEKATERARSTSAMKLADGQRRNWAELAAERIREGEALVRTMRGPNVGTGTSSEQSAASSTAKRRKHR